MKTISAVTLIKNGISFDYPFIESIKSALPFVTEYIIEYGICSDGTLELLEKEFGDNPKVKIIKSKWENLAFGTSFLSVATNMAIEVATGDYILYLQADECVDEKTGNKLQDWTERCESEGCQGITFKYLHFIRDPKTLRKTYKDGGPAYTSELRLFKNNGELKSFGDAQSFSFNEQLKDPRGPQPALHLADRFIDSNMEIFHYGFLRDPKKLLDKKKYLDKYYQMSEPGRNERIEEEDGKYKFDESEMKSFEGKHPESMNDFLKRFE